MADLQAFLSGVDAHAKRDEAYLRDVIAALNSNSVTASAARFLGPAVARSACQVEQDLIGLNIHESSFDKGALNGGKVAFLDRAVKRAAENAAVAEAGRMAAARGDDASARGSSDPVAALVEALVRKPTAAAHVDIGAKLGDIRLSDLPSACWPPPASCDWLDAQAPTRARCIALRSRAALQSGAGQSGPSKGDRETVHLQRIKEVAATLGGGEARRPGRRRREQRRRALSARAFWAEPPPREGCRSCPGRSRSTGGPWPRASRARLIWPPRWRTRTSSCRSHCRRIPFPGLAAKAGHCPRVLRPGARGAQVHSPGSHI